MKNTAWFVAASIGAVEALKDQGVCRWNNVIKSLQQHARTNIRLFVQAKNMSSSSSSSSALTSSPGSGFSEQKVLKVMALGCWGPSTTRF